MWWITQQQKVPIPFPALFFSILWHLVQVFCFIFWEVKPIRIRKSLLQPTSTEATPIWGVKMLPTHVSTPAWHVQSKSTHVSMGTSGSHHQADTPGTSQLQCCPPLLAFPLPVREEVLNLSPHVQLLAPIAQSGPEALTPLPCPDPTLILCSPDTVGFSWLHPHMPDTRVLGVLIRAISSARNAPSIPKISAWFSLSLSYRDPQSPSQWGRPWPPPPTSLIILSSSELLIQGLWGLKLMKEENGISSLFVVKATSGS